MKTIDPNQDLQDGVDLAARVEPEPMRDPQPPYPRLCSAGPCRNYHRLQIQADVESARAFRPTVELPAGTPGVTKLPDGGTLYAPRRPFHVQTNHYCYPAPGIEITLGDTPVVECSRWDPEPVGTEESRWTFSNTEAGMRHAAEIAAWRERESLEAAAAAAADDIIERAANPTPTSDSATGSGAALFARALSGDGLDRNLVQALLSVSLPSPPAQVLATIEGENDGANWHWMVRLHGGEYAYITGGCDYTGWDCVSSCEAFVESTIEAALRQVPEAYLRELTAKLDAKLGFKENA